MDFGSYQWIFCSSTNDEFVSNPIRSIVFHAVYLFDDFVERSLLFGRIVDIELGIGIGDIAVCDL